MTRTVKFDKFELAEAMADKGVDRKELASITGLSEVCVYKACNERPVYVNTACKIARALNKKTRSLLLED